MIPPDYQSDKYEEAVRLAENVRRNRRRTLRVLSGVIVAAILWPVYVEYRTKEAAAPRVSFIKPVSGPRLPPRPASPDAKRKRVYPYSVIPGGVYSAAALSRALAADPVAAEHYAGFDLSAVRPVRAAAGMRMYASYRIGDRVYWTANPIALRENEILLTDGVHLARARCGNRLSETQRTPVGPRVELDSTAADESEKQWRASDPEDRGGPAGSAYPLFQVAPDIFPDVFVEYDGGLTIGATAAAAQTTETDGEPDGNETLSGYSIPRPAPARKGSAPWVGRWAMGMTVVGIPSAAGSATPSTTPPAPAFVIPPFPGPATSSAFPSSWTADLFPWHAIVPASAAWAQTIEPIQPSPAGPALLSPAPAPVAQGAGDGGWGRFNLIVSGIAAAERGVLPGTPGGVDEGGAGGGGPASGGGPLSPAGFLPEPAIAPVPEPSVPEPAGLGLVALGLALFALHRSRSRP